MMGCQICGHMNWTCCMHRIIWEHFTKMKPSVLLRSFSRRLNLSSFPTILGVSKISCSLLKKESSGSIDNHHPTTISIYSTCVILNSFLIYWAVFNLSYILGWFFFSFLYSFSFEQKGVHLNYKDNWIASKHSCRYQFLILF